ncbi:coadhesin-like [Tigriopus californicus]|uniref:coadhesin-like n=1 Tax=Tigriopus californicus TaxID=6832 RepID=UPI0027DA99D4|nr:coadhesin-like [Tigriopus californicus]
MLRSFKEIMWMVQVSFLLALPLKLVIGFHEPTMVVRGIGCGTTREYTVWTDVIPDAKYPPCALLKSREAREAYKDVIPLWFEATPWTDCSKTCGVGDQTRTRKCQTRTGQSLLPEDCHNTGITLQGRKCNVFKCTSLTPWSEWSSCVGTCGPVLRSRNRSCQEMDTQINYPKDYCHGANLTDYEDCELDPCPKDGGWSAWNAETCPGTCGGFVVNRTRTCDNPAPLSGGLPCPGLAIETIPCGTDPCPIDGAWTEWTPWSLCPVTCGGANETRTRTCSNPAPQFDGAACPDASSNEIQECNTKACPVDGGWAEWSSNSDCSATCGGGSSVKNRFCINPPPSNGGEDCSGNDTEVMSCNENPCPIPGEWNSWSPWGMVLNQCVEQGPRLEPEIVV